MLTLMMAMGTVAGTPTSPSVPSRLATPAGSHFTDNGRKGRYGVAYLRSLAAHAGVGLQETSPDEDIDAVDVTVKFGRASAEVQIKCTSQFKVGVGSATLQLETGWIEKWTDSLVPVYVVLVKVPSVVGDWIDGKRSSTVHRTVAFGKRFDPTVHTTSMKFTRADRITAETLYDWRDEVYDFHKHGRGGAT